MRERNAMQVAYSRTKGKRYAETFRCPGGALCLDFCNSGQGIRAHGALRPPFSNRRWLRLDPRLRRRARRSAAAARRERRVAAHLGAAGAAAPLRQFDLLLAVPGRNEELQPPLVRDGELRQPHEGAPPPCPAAAQRLTSATAQPGCVWLRPTEGSRRPCRDSPGSPCSRRLRKSR